MPGHLPSSFDDNEYATISQYTPPLSESPCSRDYREFFNERPMQKVVRKLKEEPLVPLGLPTPSTRPNCLQLAHG